MNRGVFGRSINISKTRSIVYANTIAVVSVATATTPSQGSKATMKSIQKVLTKKLGVLRHAARIRNLVYPETGRSMNFVCWNIYESQADKTNHVESALRRTYKIRRALTWPEVPLAINYQPFSYYCGTNCLVDILRTKKEISLKGRRQQRWNSQI
jgi:hypothetical protein